MTNEKISKKIIKNGVIYYIRGSYDGSDEFDGRDITIIVHQKNNKILAYEICSGYYDFKSDVDNSSMTFKKIPIKDFNEIEKYMTMRGI